MIRIPLALALWLCIWSSTTFALGDNEATADKGSIAVAGDDNTIEINGITEEKYRQRLEKDTETLRSEIKKLEDRLYETIRKEGYASGKADALQGELGIAQQAITDAEEKLNDIETAYAELQDKIKQLTAEITDLQNRSPGRIPKELFDEAISALRKGDLEVAEQIIEPLLKQKIVADIIRNQAQLYFISGQIAEEQLNYSKAKSRYTRAAQLAPDDLTYLHKASKFSRLAGDYRKAEQFARDTLALSNDIDEIARANTVNELAITLTNQSRYKEAETFYRKALEVHVRVLGDENPITATIYGNLASSLAAQSRYEEADPLYRRALEVHVRVLGDEHPSTASSNNNLAFSLMRQGQYAKAEALYRKALEIRKRVLGEEHPETASSYDTLASILTVQGQYAKADPLYRKALEIRKRVLGDDNPITATSYNNLAFNLKAQGRYMKAEPLFRKGLEIRKRVLGEEHLATVVSYQNIADNFGYQGRYEEAETLIRKGLEIRKRVLGEDHPETATSYYSIAFNLNAQGRYEEAETLYLHAEANIVPRFGPKHHHAINIAVGRIDNLIDQSKFEKAINLTRDYFANNGSKYSNFYSKIGFYYYKLDQFDQAEKLWREAIHIGQATRSANDPILATWRQNLAKLYYKQKKFSEADSIYRTAFPVFLEVHSKDEKLLKRLAANYARLLREAPKAPDRVKRLEELKVRFGDQIGTTDYVP